MATRTITTYAPDGSVASVVTVEVPPEETNRDTLQARAEQALATNKTFLAIASPTNAQNAAQVRQLTQECSALIRLLLNRFEVTD